MTVRVAALYVDTASGPYPSISGVDCWGRATKRGGQVDWLAPPDRDATKYDGPHPVIAHPPCGPWGMFSWNYKGGEGDAHAGIVAVRQVQAFGGVLEHPANSKLWEAANLPKPGDRPTVFDDGRFGFTILVNQCDWGHKAQKPTWLYIVGAIDVPPMPAPGKATHIFVRLASSTKPELPKRERHITPPLFADWLVRLARQCWRPLPGESVAVGPHEPGGWTSDGSGFIGKTYGVCGDSIDVALPSGDVEPFDMELITPIEAWRVA